MDVTDLALRREDRLAGNPGLREKNGDLGQAERQPWASGGRWTVETPSHTPSGTGERAGRE